jgi:HEAT repeat protein
MKRAVFSIILLASLPAAAIAQVAPPPPTPPVAPVPAPQPVPPSRSPRAVLGPDYSLMVDNARRAAEVASQSIDTVAIREATMEARRAAEQVHASMADWHVSPFHGDFDLFQPRWSAEQDPNGSYSSGLSALQARQYERAITMFDRAIAQKSPRADAAHYHKAYAQYRNGQVQEALATIAALRRDHGQSPYVEHAKVLEADVRKTPPQEIVDDDIKLLAISAMQHSGDPERAVPLLQGVLEGTNSLRVKQRALFVLAQNTQPRAHEILFNYAKGAGIPDLQVTAIQYLAASPDKKTTAAQLQQIYASTNEVRIKAAIISAYQSTGNRTGLTNIVTTPGNPVAIRSAAMTGLAGILSPQDLWQLYEKEQDRSLRVQIVRAFGSMRALDQLNQVLRTEKDPEVRRQAIRSLGSLKSEQTGTSLVELYGREQDVETRRAIVSALSSQNNAEALIQIARSEKSLELARDIVRRLTEMAPRSKAAADYMMELIKR